MADSILNKGSARSLEAFRACLAADDRSTAYDVAVVDLLAFKDGLELSPDAFREITGFNFHSYRRGRLKGQVSLSPSIAEAIERCVGTYSLALELCGTRERALDWLYSDCPQLDNTQPISIADSKDGYDRIRQYIEKLRQLAGHTSEPLPPALSKPTQSEKIDHAPPPVAAVQKAANATPDPATHLDERCFRIRSKLLAAIEDSREGSDKAKKALSKKQIAHEAQRRGATTLTPARLNYLTYGYSASGREVIALAEIFNIPPRSLIELPVA